MALVSEQIGMEKDDAFSFRSNSNCITLECITLSHASANVQCIRFALLLFAIDIIHPSSLAIFNIDALMDQQINKTQRFCTIDVVGNCNN